MLYATTRNNTDAYTTQRVLTAKRAPDGGLFVPFRIPHFSEEEILGLGNKNFNACLTETLNLLFGARLTAYDVDFTLGRHCVRLQQLGQKILMAECWHNPNWQFSAMVQDLTGLLLDGQDVQPEISGWAETGIRIAVLFGLFGALIRENMADFQRKVDVSLISGNFSGPMSAWYARAMGLPIGNIVCCCNENRSAWDFLCHGQLRTEGVAVKTVVPEGDVVIPEGMERLIGIYGGAEEVDRYVQSLRRGGTYYVDDGLLGRMRQGLYATVSSERRILSTIPSVYATHGYLLAPSSALAYAGLQDYRSKTGEMRTALILTEKSPRLDLQILSDVTGISEHDLTRLL